MQLDRSTVDLHTNNLIFGLPGATVICLWTKQFMSHCLLSTQLGYHCYLVVIASEDPEVQASFQKLKTEHDELESDFVLMSKMEVMTKGLKKSYEVTPSMMLYLLTLVDR